MKLDRPLCTFDVESTGTEPTYDRIITIYILKEFPDGHTEEFDGKFNPQRTITDENAEIHGMTNEMVKGWPLFATAANAIHGFIDGCDICGYNISFDSTILWEELFRCGIRWDVKNIRKIDPGTIFQLKEPRTLEAALMFYCKRKHDGAHGAKADVLATRDVLSAQINRYPDLLDLDVAGLEKASQRDPKCDLNGVIVLNKDGLPSFSTKRNRGVAVIHDPGYAEWMLRSDFPIQTKEVIREILGRQQPSNDEDDEGDLWD